MDKPRDDAAVHAAMRQRFPKPRGAAAAFQFASILASNAYLLYLVVTAQASPVSLVAFNVLELIAFGLISHLVLLGVPSSARMPGAEGQNIGARIFTLVFAVGWLYAVYSFSLMVDKKNLELLAQTPGILARLQAMHIIVPLLLSVSLALVGTIGDWLSWRRSGGMFIPQMAMSGAPKILTLVFAPIVSAMCGMGFMKNQPEIATIAWSATYLLVKALSELGILAWQYFGMPEAKPNAKTAV
jgi:hypothetical protein